MRSIKERLGAVGPTRALLAAFVVAVVVAGLYLALGESGVGLRTAANVVPPSERQAAPAQQGENGQNQPDEPALVLTLSAPTTCIVYKSGREVHASYRTNDDGESEEVHDFGHWTSVDTVEVTWQVSGGAPPYSLVIDQEPEDPQGEYRGASGSAEVSCALNSGETYISDRWGERQRWHRTRPILDSGLKTIGAIVTDGMGATASATIDVYAVKRIEASEQVLERGKTYLVFGTLFTIPDEYDMRTSDTAEPEGGPTELLIEIYEEDVDAFIVINIDTGEEIGSCVLEGGTLLSGTGSCGDPGASAIASTRLLYAALREFSASRGHIPAITRP